MLNEFDIIKRFFTKSAQRVDVSLGVGDDCALVETPPNYELAITTDTLIAGVHFPLETTPYDIGYKSLAVNLSDLAAMSASPAWITLSLTLPDANEEWLTEFSRGLFDLASRYQLQLIGGDLTRGPLSITIAAYGFVPKNKALKRNAAKPGDLIYVTHTLGDAAFALKNITTASPETLARLNRPEPQIEIGIALRHIAHAAIDISDGLAADLTHILKASCVGAIVYVDRIPLSTALRELSFEEAISFALNGGDDYELCFTAPRTATSIPTSATCIGIITENSGLDLRFSNEKKYELSIAGYQHFRDNS